MRNVPPPSLAMRRSLGKNLDVSALGLGTMSLAGAYGPCDEVQGLALFKAALDSGVNFINTADIYGFGQNEGLIGQAIAGRRDEIILSTKFGYEHKDRREIKLNGRPDYVFRAVDASLKRLKVDEIDLYSLHRVDPKVPLDETIGAMGELVQKGKVRAIGLCEASPKSILLAQRIFPLTAIEMEYSLLYREEAEEVLAEARALHLAFIACAPLGRGLLTGNVGTQTEFDNDIRAIHPRFERANLTQNHRLALRLTSMAKQLECSKAQLALAYLLAQGTDVIPIFGTKQIDRLYENIGAANVRLTSTDVAELNELFPKGAAAGKRYPPSEMQEILR
jgi:aryl-alcohol dehydrogenase-like predicted oxidoreductase